MVTVVRIKNSKNWCMENKLNVYERLVRKRKTTMLMVEQG